MKIVQFYEQTGSDYLEARSRMVDDKRIFRFVKMFGNDSSFERLTLAMEAGDAGEAFRAVHDLKGVSLTLSLTSLAGSASAVTEALRSGDMKLARTLYPALKECYTGVVSLIGELEQ